MKVTRYFEATREREDRRHIRDGWIEQVIGDPIQEVVQSDGRIRRWAAIAAAGDRFLRVVLLEDGLTVHNAFFDRGFTP